MTYKISYFAIRGLAEPIRMLLVDNNIQFEDNRFQSGEWANIKNNFQFGQVPCLYDGNQQIVQSGAIIRHLARKHGLCGDNEADTTFADMVYEGVRDLHVKYAHLIYQNYEAGKQAFIETTYPNELAKFERLIKTYKNGEKFIVGDKITYADYALFEELDIALILDPHALDKFPTLKAYHERMAARPNLQAYLEKRKADKVPVNGNGKQ